MRARERIKRQAATALRAIVGRRTLIRSGRYLLNTGRFDDGNDMRFNGEMRLVDEVVKLAHRLDRGLVVFDIGANIGLYSVAVLNAVARAHLQDARIIAAEACAGTFASMSKRLTVQHSNVTVIPLHCAVSDHCGTASFNVIESGAGRNSLLPVEESFPTSQEEVAVVTIDQILADQGHPEVDLLKIDTEGHDFAVLEGARNAFHAGRLRLVQFEYNWRWIEQRAYLRDVFRFIEHLDYRLGKVTPAGIEVFEQWSPQLETLVENNYALVRRDMLPHLTVINLISSC